MSNLVSRSLTFSYHLLQGKSICNIDFDAKSCYDRVIPEIAELAAVRMGMHPHNACLIVKLLHAFRHRLIVQNEPTKSYYEDDEILRILGIGQGMGWSPTLWGLVNDVAMVLMEKYSPGELMTSPLSEREVFSCIEAYVDDVHGGVSEDGIQSYNARKNQSVSSADAIFI